MASDIIKALQIGAKLENPTPFKWASIFITVAIIILNTLQAQGWLLNIGVADTVETIMAGLTLYAQVATTDKVGLWQQATSDKT